ncbi:MAG: radical SAM protein [Candidatus Omnitrophica bacterium]|nr:radical SAM protein [Candidatus Omnitrophota bacterium]
MKFGKIIELAKDIILTKILKHSIPLKVTHNITYRCNLDCPFCLLKKKLNKPNSPEMDTSQIKRMMREFKEIGTKFWLFSGGEPLLRQDLGELISYAKDKMDFHCGISTNGTFLADKIKNDSSFKRLDLVQISLDGPKEIQDKLRGEGSYDKIISTLEVLKKMQIKTVIMTLISKHNLAHLPFLIKLADQYNANIIFQTIDTQPAGVIESKEKFFPSRNAFKQAVEELIEEKRKNRFIINSLDYLKMIRDLWPDAPHKIRCYAGQFYCEITPEGFVVPCCAKLDRIKDICNGLDAGFQKAFFQLDDMSECRDCYYAGPQELNIILKMSPLNIIALSKSYSRLRQLLK